jgi:hypothetical protein
VNESLRNPQKLTPLSPDLLEKMDAYWRAANYLTVGQIYLQDNPLLESPLKLEHIKPRLLGHWGTTTGINFIYVHLNRLIKEHDLNMIYVIGPGHGGPGLVAHSYLEGSYTERYPNIERSRNGLQRLFRQFSWPYGIPSHVAPETPGSIHEGGELGYSLLHAYGAAFDNPDLIVTCIIGDGEAETGALAASWHSNKFLNPARDGAVLPILHLNGFKIANPTVLARININPAKPPIKQPSSRCIAFSTIFCLASRGCSGEDGNGERRGHRRRHRREARQVEIAPQHRNQRDCDAAAHPMKHHWPARAEEIGPAGRRRGAVGRSIRRQRDRDDNGDGGADRHLDCAIGGKAEHIEWVDQRHQQHEGEDQAEEQPRIPVGLTFTARIPIEETTNSARHPASWS